MTPTASRISGGPTDRGHAVRDTTVDTGTASPRTALVCGIPISIWTVAADAVTTSTGTGNDRRTTSGTVWSSNNHNSAGSSDGGAF